MTYIVFDIGGTKTRVGFSDDGRNLRDTVSFHTPDTPKEGVSKIVEAITAAGIKEPKAIAGGIRGIMNEAKTGIDHDVFLTRWADFSVVDLLNDYYSVPVFLENDTALAGLGEATVGAGEGIDIVVYHTISTGVGGVKIVEGEIDAASIGFEPGHQILDIDRTILGDDVSPTLENLVSGTALESRMGVKPYEIPQDDVIWDELAGYLAQGLRNTILYWSPDVIVLGGSMITGDPKIHLEAIRKATVAALDGVVPCPFITIAKLGDQAGLHGALTHIRNHLNIR